MKIHKEGTPTILITFFLLAVLVAFFYYFFPAILPFVLGFSIVFFGFIISFFRLPNRDVLLINNNQILSPCDGKVVVIENVFEPEYLKTECTQVSIFMSPLNVHVNWFPQDATVLYSKYHPGTFLAAWNPKASTENERTTICYTQGNHKVLLRQVAGALARRIVNYAVEGKSYKQGDEMGFIKFGSRVDLYLPNDANIQVKLEQKVTGNRTVIATIG